MIKGAKKLKRDFPDEGKEGGVLHDDIVEDGFYFVWPTRLGGVRYEDSNIRVSYYKKGDRLTTFEARSERPVEGYTGEGEACYAVVTSSMMDGYESCVVGADKAKVEAAFLKRRLQESFGRAGHGPMSFDEVLKWLEKDADQIREYFRFVRSNNV